MREHGIDPATGHLASCRYSGIYDTGLIRRLRTNAAALLASREAHLLGLAKDFRDAAEVIERLARVSLSLPASLGTNEIIKHRMAGQALYGGALLGVFPQHAPALSELFPTCFPAGHAGAPDLRKGQLAATQQQVARSAVVSGTRAARIAGPRR
jgi:hypothetical protein